MSKKFITEQIEKIRKHAFTDVPAMLEKESMSEKDYLTKCRVPLNFAIIQTLIGGEIVDPKKAGKEFKIKFNKALPDKTELAQLVGIVNEYIDKVENPFLESLQPAAPIGSEDDDMDIPEKDDDNKNSSDVRNVPQIEKVNGKKLREYIFGYGGKSSMANEYLTAMDCLDIAALGEDVRRKDNRNRMLLIGGVALLLTAGVVTAVVIHEKKKDAATDGETDVIEDTETPAEVNIDETEATDSAVNIDDDEAPVVSID